MVLIGLLLFGGGLNALYIMPAIIYGTNRNNLDIVAQGKYLPTIKEILQMLITFGLTVFAWIFFRAENIKYALNYVSKILSASLFKMPAYTGIRASVTTIILVVIFMLIEWNGREGQYGISHLGLKWKKPFRYIMYYAIIIAIFWFNGKEQQFIYFQF